LEHLFRLNNVITLILPVPQTRRLYNKQFLNTICFEDHTRPFVWTKLSFLKVIAITAFSVP